VGEERLCWDMTAASTLQKELAGNVGWPPNVVWRSVACRHGKPSQAIDGSAKRVASDLRTRAEMISVASRTTVTLIGRLVDSSDGGGRCEAGYNLMRKDLARSAAIVAIAMCTSWTQPCAHLEHY